MDDRDREVGESIDMVWHTCRSRHNGRHGNLFLLPLFLPTNDRNVTIIKADPEPFKIQPADEGGKTVDHQNLMVVDILKVKRRVKNKQKHCAPVLPARNHQLWLSTCLMIKRTQCQQPQVIQPLVQRQNKTIKPNLMRLVVTAAKTPPSAAQPYTSRLHPQFRFQRQSQCLPPNQPLALPSALWSLKATHHCI